MKSKTLVFLLVCCLVAAFSEATLLRGSVAHQKSKAYVFTPDFTGTALLDLIFDNPTADLDLRLAVTDQNGDLVPVAFSESSLKQFETLQIGVAGGTEYTIIVQSFKGPSAFRLNFDGTFTTTGSAGAAGVVSRGVELREVTNPSPALLRFMEKSQKLVGR